MPFFRWSLPFHRRARHLINALFCFFVVLGFDLLTKNIARLHLIHSYKQVFKGVLGIDFALCLVENQGGAWGVFSSHSSSLFFFRLVMLCFLLALVFFSNKRDSLFCAIIAGGALGNIIDTYMHGAVTDFFHFTLWGYSFPVFNVADIAIFCGVVSLALWGSLTLSRRSR